ncbi:hypothetical protein ABIE44_003709 [Marmoricola sp. OAE513]|uniref:group I intron-associated PD-(D/E)XK endonuclease n=1 Tax=Marmoricola sp. OAE513 TaxID=2817894 RepID=UPI001AE43517
MVLRSLGLSATSSGAIRSVRRHADRLALDYHHFTGGRSWTPRTLADAVAASTTWRGVGDLVGVSDDASVHALRGHATRLGIDTDHLEPQSTFTHRSTTLRPDPANLPRAGSLLAAAHYELCGCPVSWPLEPRPFDLLVERAEGFVRVQVKTTRLREGGSWKVSLLSGRRTTPTYSPDEIDEFFVIDGDLRYYAIPISTVGGLSALNLNKYEKYLVSQQSGFSA